MIVNLLLHCLFLESVTAYIASNPYPANFKTTVSPLSRNRHAALKTDMSVMKMISGRFGYSSIEAVSLSISNAAKSSSVRGCSNTRVQKHLPRGHKSDIITLFCTSPNRGFEDNIVEQAIEEQPVVSEVSTLISEMNDSHHQHHHDSHLQQQSLIVSHLDIPLNTLTEEVKSAEAETTTPIKEPHNPMVITALASNAVAAPIKKKENGFKTFFKGNWLVMGEVIVIYLAHLNPGFGATGGRLKPEFFISKLGVFTIFFINGIALSIGK